MRKHTNRLDKYLKHYAEPEIALLSKLSGITPKKHVLIIPTFDEDTDFIERLVHAPFAHQILLILVVNEAPNTHIRAQKHNQYLLHSIRQRLQNKSCAAPFDYGYLKKLSVLLIERTHLSSPIPLKQGVGLARKIACDLACALFRDKKIHSPWIYSSDADALLPDNYFCLDDKSELSAAVFEFKHTHDNTPLSHATAIYEACIRYYRDQVLLAGSHYGFHALGSCLAVNIESYGAVRGFPKRSAGEDFYLLNKLAKIGKIQRIDSVIIDIQSRLSLRVPFGTGPAVKKILEQLEQQLAIHYYHEGIFLELKTVLEHAPTYWESMQHGDFHLEYLSEASREALKAAGFCEFLKKRTSQDRNLETFLQNFHAWFDGFQTLKFVKRLQTSHYPSKCIDSLPGLAVPVFQGQLY